MCWRKSAAPKRAEPGQRFDPHEVIARLDFCNYFNKHNTPKEKGDIMQTYAMNREINMDNEYDLVVAGGGPGGTAAAICAARLGAKVLLLEATI
jgi:NADPH-dependent 2,4-dienoyl-CoA reductase/sulfur reductase-like enzyme